MKTLPHTPGPWFLGDATDPICIYPEEGRCRFEPGHGTTLYPIATINPFKPEEDRANARVIEQSPKMLGLLRRICGREYVQAEFLAALDEARALLAKLDGEAA